MPLLPAAIGIILNSNRKEVLLIKRRDVPVWVLPGGGIEKNEAAEEAMKREIYEETGFHVRILRQAAEYRPINCLAAKTSLFICQIESGASQLSSETEALSFYPLDSLPKGLFPPHANWLREALASSTFIQRPLTEITYRRCIQFLLRHPFLFFRYAWTRFTKK